ncbi:hypothetical protein ACFL6C_12325, partial [Myxococcota bacterium]
MLRRWILALLVAGCSDTTPLVPTISEIFVEDLNLGSHYVGDLVNGDLIIEAVGTGRSRVAVVACEHAEIDIDFSSVTLNPGSSVRVPVTWRPTAPGDLAADILVRAYIEHQVGVTGIASMPPACDDGNPCTTDRFDRDQRRCLHEVRSGTCDDHSACTVDDRCVEGQCRGVARICDDQSSCTFDLCDPAVGCRFLVDQSRCDDHDPCTVDLCDDETGCSYSDAPDGTACGPVSCARAHTCVLGACEPLDVSGIMEGLPCPGGERCTDGGVCEAGECVGGGSQVGPAIVAQLQTYGGENSFVATDAYRYLFAGIDGVSLTTEMPGVGLVQTSWLDLRVTLPPVLLSPGMFVVATARSLALVDAIDTASMHVVTELPLVGTSGFYPVMQLAAVPGGVVVSTRIPLLANHYGPFFIPISDGSFGLPITLGASTSPIGDLDADGGAIAWLDNYGLNWLQLDTAGNVTERVTFYTGYMSSYYLRVSVESRRVAVLHGGSIEVFEVPEVATCEPSAYCQFYAPSLYWPTIPEPSYLLTCGDGVDTTCVSGTSCREVWVHVCQPEPELPVECEVQRHLCLPDLYAIEHLPVDPYVADIALTEWPIVYGAGPSGVRAFMLAPDVAGEEMSIDPMPAAWIDEHAGHLLASGPIALPIRLTDLATATRVTGPLHGNASAAVPLDGEHVLVGGPVALGRLRVTDAAVETWELTSFASTPARPRVLRAGSDTSVVNRVIRGSDTGWPNTCSDLAVQIVGSDSDVVEQPLCGLYGSWMEGTIDATGDWLWVYNGYVMSSIPPTELRVWQLGGSEQPLAMRTVTQADFSPALDVRAADNGTHVAVVARHLSADVEIEIHANPPDSELLPVATLAVPLPDPWHSSGRDRVGLDFPLLMWGRDHGVDIYNVTVDVGPLPLDIPNTDAHVRVTWMRDGRAWLRWQPGNDLVVSSHQLTQVAYDSTSIEDQGTVLLPSEPRQVLDMGDRVVVLTPSQIFV